MLSMVLALALAQAAAAEPQPRAMPEREARATVRIMRAEPIRLGQEQGPGSASLLRQTSLRESDGSVRAASLVEFY